MANIWKNLPHPAVLLAPMEGVTDIMFRQVVARAGDLAKKHIASKTSNKENSKKSIPTKNSQQTKLSLLENCAFRPDLFFTEFTNVSSYASEKGRANALERLAIAPSDQPIIAQVWGKEPSHFAETVAALEDLGFSGVDLNYGCPDRHVNKAGGGAAMIQNPELAKECLQRAKESTKLPVSVKTRLGWSQVEEFREWLPILLAEHPAALTVHLRTKKEMSKVPAHYEIIPEIVKLRDELSPETKLIINGDIRDRLMALEMSQQFPEVDGYMIGRGVMQNPFCFFGLKDSDLDKENSQIFVDLLKFHLDLYEKERKKRYISYETLKHFFKIYVNNFPGAAEVRMKLMETHSVPEAREIIREYLS